MWKIISISIILLFAFSCEQKIPQPVEDYGFQDYALYDHTGDFHRMSTYNNSKAIVLFVQGNACPMVRQEYPEFEKLKQEYKDEGVVFFMINSNTQDTRTAINQEAINFKWNTPILIDSAQLVAEELDITVTTETFVLNPVTREIIYRGPISDKFGYESQREKATKEYVASVLDAIIDNKKPEILKTFAKGCKVNRLSATKKKVLTYTKDIAPILRDNCIKCHNDKGIAPWSMSNYETIKGWSPMIKEVLLSKRMPPYRADPFIGDLKNRQNLEDSSANKLIRWINEGAKKGTGEDILAAIKYKTPEWALGEPDKIIELHKTVLPATGILDYTYRDIALNNTEGKWLKGLALKYTNQKVVHHSLFQLEQGLPNPINKRNKVPWVDNLIAAISSGNPYILYPENSGIYLPPQAKIKAQIHYTTTGKEEENIILIGLYYADTKPTKALYSLGPSKYGLKILPYKQNVKYTQKEKIEKDITLYYALPHMHYRGKKMMVKVQYPDKKIDTILSVPDYNFNWQWQYEFAKPIKIPAGSIIEIEAVFDNSFQNPLNPDPSANVVFGLQSNNEMMMTFINYTIDEE